MPQFDPEIIPIRESIRMDSSNQADYLEQLIRITTHQNTSMTRTEPLEWPLTDSQTAQAGSQSIVYPVGYADDVGPENSDRSSDSGSSLFDTTPELSDATENSPVISRRQSFVLSSSSTEDEVLEQEGLYHDRDQYER